MSDKASNLADETLDPMRSDYQDFAADQPSIRKPRKKRRGKNESPDVKSAPASSPQLNQSNTNAAPKDAIFASEVVTQHRLEELIAAGRPSDPLERKLIEQATTCELMSNHLLGLLCRTTNPEHIEIYSAAASKVMAELRRTILAIKEYRATPVRPQVNVIEQQNIAHRQDVSYSAPIIPPTPQAGESVTTMKCHDKEGPEVSAGTNRLRGLGNRDDADHKTEISGARSCREAQPATAGGINN